ncbi:MAG: S-layer domain protein [Haloquadratum walsbyi J07HQW2]|jgi:S-layer domain|uniref:S-layer domain protein n=2 Tax=Haloquadratum walsbyi TaxID=293091 RepID=U1NH11_9EURY|nr:MAG: S-layer domain protein [Haloquadratum walsbyi J07HQW2]
MITAGFAGPVAAAEELVVGSPNITVSSADVQFRASESATLSVTVNNDGQLTDGGRVEFENEVQTAQSVRIDIAEDQITAPIEINTGTQTLGSLNDGQSETVDFALDIGRATPGTYQIPVEVTYSHTRAIAFGQFEDTDRQNRERTITEEITIRIEDRPEFDMSADETNAITAGDNGQIGFNLQNIGTETAGDATVRLQTQTPGVFFGKQASQSVDTSVFVSAIEPDANEQITVQMGAGPDVAAGTYTVTAIVEFEDENGITKQSDPLQAGITVREERTFDLEDVELSDFRVDEPEAQIEATIVNRGPTAAENVVVSVSGTETIAVTSAESAVGDLGVGDTAPVSFTLNIPGEAEPGSISLPFAVEYENEDGDVLQTSTPIRQSVTIQSEQDRFEVVGTETGVTPGGSATLDVTLRYTGSETVSDANAKLFTNDPLSSADDGAFLGTVEPGTTTTATFRVSSSSDAIAKEYASSVEVRYDEADGDTRFTGSLPIGVSVSAGDSGGLPLMPIGAVAVLAVLGGGVVLYRRV